MYAWCNNLYSACSVLERTFVGKHICMYIHMYVYVYIHVNALRACPALSESALSCSGPSASCLFRWRKLQQQCNLAINHMCKLALIHTRSAGVCTYVCVCVLAFALCSKANSCCCSCCPNVVFAIYCFVLCCVGRKTTCSKPDK